MTIQELFTKLNLSINDDKLITKAFVHRSFLNESADFTENNERLEYLGDAVLELATSRFLYDKFPNLQEGMLTNLRAALVRTTSLASIAKTLGLSDLLMISKGEEAGGGRDNISLLADALEALLGAIYLDSGYDAVVQVLSEHLFPRVDAVLENVTYKDKKSQLQEIAQAKFRLTPKYELISEEGPDHDKNFVMAVMLGSSKYGTGSGKNKQTAQEEAARSTLEIINNS